MDLLKEVPQSLTTKEFMEREDAIHMRAMRERTTIFTLRIYGFLVFSTVIIILLQGFKFGGFSLESSFLHWLGGAIIGEIGILAGLVYSFFFKKK
ncbi:MAG: hypothetical protein ACOZF2_15270 [Thermodesulfobacteriota bacterium]